MAKTPPDQTTAPANPASGDFRKNLLLGGALIIAVVVAYLPVWHAGFIWDDDMHITANPVIVGPLGLKEIWTTSAAQYYPLVLTTFWLEYAVWGLHPLPFHLVNVLMQAGAAIVLWRVLRNLNVAGAWLGAALWAVHPVQVETVAWITEMKNTQSGLFFLLSILFFVKATRLTGPDDRDQRLRNDVLAWLFAALAVASKSSTVVLPAVLGLCAWWIEGRWNWRTLARVAPTIVMALAAAALAVWTVKLQGVDASARSWPDRFITAGYVVWFYLGKLIWPHPLIFIYPRWNIGATPWLGWFSLTAVIALLVLLWIKRRSWGRPGFFAFAYFLIALAPVLGLVNHYFLRYSFVADHLQYLASMGPLALAGAALATGSARVLRGNLWLRPALAFGLVSVLVLLSWKRARTYENQQTLWTDTLEKNPQCWMAENNLGDLYFRRAQTDLAIAHYRKALAISPNYAEVYNNLGVALSRKGRLDEAMTNFQTAVRLDPGLAPAHENLGNAFLRRGQTDEAIDQFHLEEAIFPYGPPAEYNLGNAFLQEGHVDDAVAQYRKVLEVNPKFAEAYSNLGLALSQEGRLDDAIAELRKAVALDPDFAQAHNNLGLALAQSGQVEAALAEFKEAVRLKPGYLAAQNNLSHAMMILNQPR